MKRTFRLLFFMLFCLLLVSSASADVLRLPAGLKVIEEEAFFGDRNIDEVVLPEGIEVIGERAFAKSGLTKINLPSSLKKIGDNAFDEGVTFTAEEGTDFTNMLLKAGILKSPASLFKFRVISEEEKTCELYNYNMRQDREITVVSIPDYVPISDDDDTLYRVTAIAGNTSFGGATHLTHIHIPNTIESIGMNAFRECSALLQINIPDSVTSIEKQVFLR